MDQLDALPGLSAVKQEIRRLHNFLWLDQRRREKGKKTSKPQLHMIFSGGPGTGKTTVARLIAALFAEIGLLSRGHLVEVDRSQLVGGYLGQTAIKTREVLDSARGGILFIDEAYTLAGTGNSQDSYGAEALATIVKFMEDHRDDFALIAAGYSEEMEAFLESNPGLRSRFSRHLKFADYTVTELLQILHYHLGEQHYALEPNALAAVGRYLTKRIARAGQGEFANGREVRNLLQRAIEEHAGNLRSSGREPSENELSMLTDRDFAFLELDEVLSKGA
jgi:SpoVK/Ycf46/Vps4 family AAA+-type ATPase